MPDFAGKRLGLTREIHDGVHRTMRRFAGRCRGCFNSGVCFCACARSAFESHELSG